MAFREAPRFPEKISLGSTGGPAFNTEVARSTTGHENRNSNWEYPLHKWDVAHGVRRLADYEVLRAFFFIVRGRLYGFRFKDWTDFSADHNSGVATELTSTTFQLHKRYSLGAYTLDRKILKPISGVVVHVNGVVTAHTLDTATGIVTIVSSPDAADISWSGQFDVPVRFDVDHLAATMEDKSLERGFLMSWNSIPIIELRSPE